MGEPKELQIIPAAEFADGGPMMTTFFPGDLYDGIVRAFFSIGSGGYRWVVTGTSKLVSGGVKVWAWKVTPLDEYPPDETVWRAPDFFSCHEPPYDYTGLIVEYRPSGDTSRGTQFVLTDPIVLIPSRDRHPEGLTYTREAPPPKRSAAEEECRQRGVSSDRIRTGGPVVTPATVTFKKVEILDRPRLF